MSKILEARKQCDDVVYKINKATGIHGKTVKRYLKIMKVECKIVTKKFVDENEALNILEVLKVHGTNYNRIEEAVDKKLSRK